MSLVAGIDSSTQSTKVVVVDTDDGRVVASGSAPHPSTTPPVSEQDPTSWWSALGAAWEQCGPAVNGVEAISVAGQQHGMVALDEGGVPVHPAKLWNDTESAAQADLLVARLGPEEWARRCGTVPTASFTITKLAWLSEAHPGAFARIRRVLLPHDWLTWMLLGRPAEAVTDRGDASGTGWWSPATGAADADLLAVVGVSQEWLPRVLGPVEVAGSAGQLAPGVLVGAGTGDNMAAALGFGLRPGDVALSLGTSGTAFAVSEYPTADASGDIAGFADADGRFLPLACTLNAMKVTDWIARMTGVAPHQLDAIVTDSPPGANGVVLVPHLDGERTPRRPHATGTLSGLRTSTTSADLTRAAFEGVVCGLLHGVDALGVAGVDTSGRLLLAGGGARSSAYRQILADLSGRVIVTPTPDAERVALGAAAQAAALLTGERPSAVGARWLASESAPIETEPRLATGVAAEIRERFRVASG